MTKLESIFGTLNKSDAAYIEDLMNVSSVTRLQKEPRMLEKEAERFQQEIEQLAVDNYGSFVENSRCVRDTRTAIHGMDVQLKGVLDNMPRLITSCEEFSVTAKVCF